MIAVELFDYDIHAGRTEVAHARVAMCGKHAAIAAKLARTAAEPFAEIELSRAGGGELLAQDGFRLCDRGGVRRGPVVGDAADAEHGEGGRNGVVVALVTRD